MDVLSLNQRFIRELLELYRDLPAVWKIKCPEYKNKVAKAQAYDLLVQKCKEYVPDADREFVKNKINSLRTSFRKELRKVQAAQAKAKDISEVYIPNLWYYNMLTFTADQEYNRSSSSSYASKYDTSHILEEQETSSHDEGGFFNEQVRKLWIVAMKRDNFKPSANSRLCSAHFLEGDFIFNFGQKSLKDDAVPSIFNFPAHLHKKQIKKRSARLQDILKLQSTSSCDVSIQSLDTPKPESVITEQSIRKRSVAVHFDDFKEENYSILQDFKSEPTSPDMLLEERDPLSSTNEPSPRKKPRPDTVTTSRLSANVPEDVFDAIGKNVAHKLRGMSQQQRIIAEKIISDVMYHGQMETLTVDAHLSLNKNS